MIISRLRKLLVRLILRFFELSHVLCILFLGSLSLARLQLLEGLSGHRQLQRSLLTCLLQLFLALVLDEVSSLTIACLEDHLFQLKGVLDSS